MPADVLHRVFRTLHDPTRLRLLHLLEREELAVQELTGVLGLAQSTVSHHLGVLRDAGLVRDRRDGTHTFYSLRLPDDPVWHEVWGAARRALDDDPAARADAAALAVVFRARAARTRAFFEGIGPEWDSLREVLNDDAYRARAIARLAPDGLLAVDVGTGTGVLAVDLARAGMRVIAVDHAEPMLRAAAENARRAGPGIEQRIEFRRGDADSLPVADGEVNAVFAHTVLQYVAQPADAVREMARVLRPGGRAVIVDFVHHDRDWMSQKLGTQWSGFATEQVVGWLQAAGLRGCRLEVQPPDPPGSELPATFIASATRPVAH